MKKLLAITAIVLVAMATWAFNREEQDPARPEYVIVTSSTYVNQIAIYRGTATPPEIIEFKRGSNFQDRIVETLGRLGEKGYELVSQSSHVLPTSSGGGYIEIYYTFKLK